MTGIGERKKTESSTEKKREKTQRGNTAQSKNSGTPA
jgi:hypothetical protein